VQILDELEVVARAHGREEAAGELALLAGDHDGRRQVPGLRVDGVSEQQELHDGDADDHPEGDSIAPELHELLQHDGPPAVPRKALHGGAR
jgi:hypothetical protein